MRKRSPFCACGEKRRWNAHDCLACHAAYMRRTRKPHRLLPDEARRKANARSYLNVYVRRGYVKRGPCEVCGAVPAQGHHHDYSKPLEVRWLCKQHHALEHVAIEERRFA